MQFAQTNYPFPSVIHVGINSTKILPSGGLLPSDGQFLNECGAIFSPNNYFMLLQQDDGNLNLWDVSYPTIPLKLWSSNTTAPDSTWQGTNNKLAEGTWSPSDYVTTFNSGVKVQKKSGYEPFTDIHSSLNGQVLNATTISNSYLLLRNDGNLVQTADGRSTPIYTSKTAPVFAPIQWSDGSSKRFVTASASKIISFDLCNDRSSTQLWKHNSNGQVVNQGTSLCLDGAAGSSARSNTCDSKKASQKWKWVNGYLQVTSCLKAIPGTIDTSFMSLIGVCTGPRMAWNK
jgi:hypothetical protein